MIAFCIGLQLRADKTKPLVHILYIVTFGAMSAIGIGIGLGVSSGGKDIDSPSYDIGTATVQG